MNKSNHTELPWSYQASGFNNKPKPADDFDIVHKPGDAELGNWMIAPKVRGKANAALIVHRVNNWDKLVEALEFYAKRNTPTSYIAKQALDKKDGI